MRSLPPSRIAVSLSLVTLLLVTRTAHAEWARSPFALAPAIMPGEVLNVPRCMVPDGTGGAFALAVDSRSGNEDIYLQRITSQGDPAPGWPATGVPVVVAPGNQDAEFMLNGTSMVSDGAGGVIVGWVDFRTGPANGDIYATRINGSGSVVPGWPVAVSTQPKNEGYPQVASDGAGGAFLVWDFEYLPTDWDIWGAHVLSNGAVLWVGPLYEPSGVQKDSHIAADGEGGFFAAFLDSATGSTHVRAMRVSGANVTLVGVTTLDAQPNGQNNLEVAADSTHGMFLAWDDYRNGFSTQIYATHVDSTLTPISGWLTDGNLACTNTVDQVRPKVMADATGGCYVGWDDYRKSVESDIYAQHFQANGSTTYGWPTDGVPVCTASGFQYLSLMVPDAVGGAIFGWLDQRDSPSLNENDAYAQRLNADGSLAPNWPINGAPVAIAPYLTYTYAMSPDSSGGALLMYVDASGITTFITRVERIDRFGTLGNSEPVITRVTDVPNDQGGQVQLTWTASDLDAPPHYPIASYRIWRSTPLAAATRAIRSGGSWMAASEPAPAPGQRRFRRGASTTTAYAWEYLGSQPAQGFAQYSYTAPTLVDSTNGAPNYTSFLVTACAGSNSAFWDSKPDSGYSIDNLPPSPPVPFAGVYAGGVNSLTWGQSPQPDVIGYRLYRGTDSGFVPAPSNLVIQTTALSYVDPAGSPHWYKIDAVDAHGNVSTFLTTLPSGSVGVDPSSEPHALALTALSGNPSHARLALEFDLPSNTPVTLDLLDIQGRHVSTLARGVYAPGRYTASWDGTGSIGAGVYLAVLDAGGRKLTRRVVLLP